MATAFLFLPQIAANSLQIITKRGRMGIPDSSNLLHNRIFPHNDSPDHDTDSAEHPGTLGMVQDKIHH